VLFGCLYRYEIDKILGGINMILDGHTIENETSAGCQGEELCKVGNYTVYYLDGTVEKIQLHENLNIGRNNVWCGRRFNCVTFFYETDLRIQKLCYFTRPIKKTLDDGKLVSIYDFEWINPEPDKVIEKITISADENEKPFIICVYNINIINSLGGKVQ